MINFNNSLVSVVIPSKDRAGFVQCAINSVLAQTYKKIEIIVVDDGSDLPLSPIILEKYRNSIVTVLRHKKSCGPSATRNTGARYANGEYIAFLDDDDIWMPQKIEKQLEAFSCIGDEFGVVYCGYDFIVGRNKMHRENRYFDKYNIYPLSLSGCPVGSPTPLIRKQFFEKVGGFDIQLAACEDWDLWIRLSQICKFYPVKEPLALYRIHGNQISTNIVNKIDARKFIVKKHYKELKKYPIILSSHYRRIGTLYSLINSPVMAKFFYKMSIRFNKFNYGSWFHFALHHLGSLGQGIDKILIKKYGTLKINNIRIVN